MDNKKENRSRANGAIEVDHDKIINELTSLLSIASTPASLIRDTGNMIHAPLSISAEPSQAQIKLDRETCQILERDIEASKSHSKIISGIVQQLLSFTEGANAAAAAAAAADNDTSTPPPSSSSLLSSPNLSSGATKDIAASSTILNTLTKLEWLACICKENSVGLENLTSALASGDHIWTLVPSALYVTFDSMIQLLILWKKLGSRIDLRALVSGKPHAVLPDTDPQVTHVNTEITALLATRQAILHENSRVPITEILLDVLIPVLKVIEDRLR
uniref:Wsv023-like protein n=1 Tax=Metapenaeus ensis nimavirus TaxID=2133794 RepID=A0A401IPB0_9VIRU|nr:wsv023-like protein [Metapenaeus ensis nimavirus]